MYESTTVINGVTVPEVSLTTAETAKLLRAELKAHWPGVKFSVRSDVYSGGSSIRVRWTDGPLEGDVEAVAKLYEGKGFDGSIDLAYYKRHYQAPDGSIGFLSTSGTEGSMGAVPGIAYELPAGAKVLHMGAGYVFCSRDITNYELKVKMAESWILYHVQGIEPYQAEREAHDCIRRRLPGETVWQAYRRIHHIGDFVAARQAAVEAFGSDSGEG